MRLNSYSKYFISYLIMRLNSDITTMKTLLKYKKDSELQMQLKPVYLFIINRYPCYISLKCSLNFHFFSDLLLASLTSMNNLPNLSLNRNHFSNGEQFVQSGAQKEPRGLSEDAHLPNFDVA